MTWMHVEHEPEYWVHLPMDDAEITENWKNEKHWAKSEALVLRSFNGLDRDRKEEKYIANQLMGMRQAYKQLDMARDHYVYFAHPTAKPLPVLIAYWQAEEGDRDQILRKHARADRKSVV